MEIKIINEMEQYKFINPSLWNGVTVDDAVAELERIRQKHGTLEPGILVDESADKNAPLHKCFQWDDTKAAIAYRKEQARKLIGNITCVVVTEEVKTTVRAYVNVETSESFNRTYVPIADAIVDDVSYKDLLRQAKRDMDAFIGKYAQIEELGGVKRSMLAAIDQIERECDK